VLDKLDTTPSGGTFQAVSASFRSYLRLSLYLVDIMYLVLRSSMELTNQLYSYLYLTHTLTRDKHFADLTAYEFIVVVATYTM
jgi:hypothetical protein